MPCERAMKGIGHIFFDGFTGELWCKNCDKRYKPKLPMPVTLFVVVSKQFIKDHKSCGKEVRK